MGPVHGPQELAGSPDELPAAPVAQVGADGVGMGREVGKQASSAARGDVVVHVTRVDGPDHGGAGRQLSLT